MSEVDRETLLSAHRKETKELQSKIQKLKHSIPKGDKKKKKEVTAEIEILFSELKTKQDNELKSLEAQDCIENPSNASSQESNLVSVDTSSIACEIKSNDSTISYYKSSQEEITPAKMTKAQKRRIKKAVLEKEREKAIAEQEIENLHGLRQKESDEIKTKLSERHLELFQIASDGDCLYKAIEHQLQILNLKQMSVKCLREATSKYLLDHMDEYLPFMSNAENSSDMSKEQYVQYCENIVTSSEWGGHIEIAALAHICGNPIEVIQANGPSVITGDKDAEPKLIICYHRHIYGLGEHYNSIVPAKVELDEKN